MAERVGPTIGQKQAALPLSGYVGSLMTVLATARAIGALKSRRLRFFGAPVAQAEEAAKPQAPPVGAAAACLMFLAELVGAHELFTAGTAKKPSPAVLFVKGALHGWDKCSLQMGRKQGGGQVTSMVKCLSSEVVGSEEKMAIVHALVMLCLTASLTVMLLQRSLFERNANRSTFGLLAAALLTLVIFCVFYGGLLAQLWSKIVVWQLVVPMQITIRAVAFALTEQPGEDGDGTPPIWSVLQCGAVFTLLLRTVSSELLFKEVQTIKDAKALDGLYMLIDSFSIRMVAPLLCSGLWLIVGHLRNYRIHVALTLIVAMSGEPGCLWKFSAWLAGKMGEEEASGVGIMIQGVTLAYCMTSMLTLVTGGTVNLMCTFLLVQVMLRVHGIEAFMPVSAAAASA
mmetsp:Transcript_32135/g.73531  ORF Transcript_32135/g.73531 Transcript_32135/m.73531 type:complete len:399 (-) Transcript_32135:96-1292(-)